MVTVNLQCVLSVLPEVARWRNLEPSITKITPLFHYSLIITSCSPTWSQELVLKQRKKMILLTKTSWATADQNHGTPLVGQVYLQVAPWRSVYLLQVNPEFHIKNKNISGLSKRSSSWWFRLTYNIEAKGMFLDHRSKMVGGPSAIRYGAPTRTKWEMAGKWRDRLT
jgi:hypothetical protein